MGERLAVEPGRVAARDERRVLVVGAARSGTTWVAQLLGRTADASYVHEPDNHDWVPFAARARAGMGHLPVVEVGEEAPPLYGRLWDEAFRSRHRSVRKRLAVRLYSAVPASAKSAILEPDGGPLPPRMRMAMRLSRPASAEIGPSRHVVKSVNVPLALEWLVARLQPTVLLVRRHPLDVLASRVKLGPMYMANVFAYFDPRGIDVRVARWRCPDRPPADDRFANFVWLAGFTLSAYDEVADAHPEFHVVDHEELCVDPVPHFRRLVSDLGLQWSDACDDFLRSSNSPGTGFETKRAGTTQSGTWLTHLSEDQLRVAREILSGFPIARRYPELNA